MPITDAISAARPRLRSRRRSVSRPVSEQEQAHADGAERVEQVELLRIRREERRERAAGSSDRTGVGPRAIPAVSSPTTAGKPRRLAISAPRRATATSSASCTSSKNTAWPDRPGMGVGKAGGP